jgi:hypothetical protein
VTALADCRLSIVIARAQKIARAISCNTFDSRHHHGRDGAVTTCPRLRLRALSAVRATGRRRLADWPK